MNFALVECVKERGREVLLTPPATKHTDPSEGHSMSADLSTVLSNHVYRWSLEQRLLDGVQRIAATGCWEWKRCRTLRGYGKIGVKRQPPADTHRLSYALYCGPLAPGKYICHRCDNPACCNPVHLFQGSPQDNTTDMVAKGRQRHLRGSQVAKTKLTEADVVRIRREYAEGRPRAELASETGLDPSTITSIARGRIWKHVPGAVPPRGKGRKPKSKAETTPC